MKDRTSAKYGVANHSIPTQHEEEILILSEALTI